MEIYFKIFKHEVRGWKVALPGGIRGWPQLGPGRFYLYLYLYLYLCLYLYLDLYLDLDL